MAERSREIDRQIARKFYGLEWIQEEEDGELYGWDHHAADTRYPEFTSSYFGLIPHFSEDAEAVREVEEKIEESGCRDEYARALETLGTSAAAATAEERCRAALEIHAVYEQKIKDRAAEQSRQSNLAFAADEARADEIMSGVEERLRKLVENRSFRFIETYKDEAEDYLRSLVTFIGLSKEEIESLEFKRSGLPHVYRAYLRRFGRARGQLFAGSDADPPVAGEYLEMAFDLVEGTEQESILDESPFIFMFHQGYSFRYFFDGHASAFDAPIYEYVEGAAAPKQIAAGFAELLDNHLRLMEENNRREREMGGYFLSITGGYERRVYPALDEGRTPLDTGDQFI